MNRCVRIIDTDGNSILPSAGRAVKIGSDETFRDVLRKLAPGPGLQGMSVQLTLKAGSPVEDAMDTQDLDEKVSDILQLVASSLGYEAMLITFLVARPSPEPSCEHPSPPSAQTAVGAELASAQPSAEECVSRQPALEPEQGVAAAVPGDTSNREPRGTAHSSSPDTTLCADTGCERSGFDAEQKPDMQTPPGLSRDCAEADTAVDDTSVDQHFLTVAEVARLHGVDEVTVPAEIFIEYLTARNCGFLADEPRFTVLAKVLNVLANVTPALMDIVQRQCSLAHSHLSTLALTFRPADPYHRPEQELTIRSTGLAVQQATNWMLDTYEVTRVLRRREWSPVMCFLSALVTAATCAVEGEHCSQDPGGHQAAARCRHCGTECQQPRVGQKRSAPSAAGAATLRELKAIVSAPSGTDGEHVAARKFSLFKRRDSFYSRATLTPSRSRRIRWLQDRLGKSPPQPLSEWEPCAEAIVDASYGYQHADRPCLIFPYGGVSITNGNGRKKEWFLWRLPVCTDKELAAANARMVAFFVDDLEELRLQARR